MNCIQMLVTSLVNDYLTKAVVNNNNNNNNNTMVQSIDVPLFYHNRINSMADEMLSLKWNNHNATFANILPMLRDQEVFVDVTLACGGKVYPAHKFVLTTCSEYFREMLSKSPCKHPVVFMKDVSGRDLEALLDFMYRGEVNVPQAHLASLIRTAEALQVKGLAIPDDHQQASYRRARDLSTPRSPPAPSSVSPPPKRKRMKEENYTPVGALNMMYSSMSPQEPNSPYDLSQKSSSSSVSQSEALHNDRPHSVSPDQPTHHHQPSHPPPPPSAPSSLSYHNNKENSPEEARIKSRTPDDAPQRISRSPPPRSISPQPAPSTPPESSCKDSPIKEESDAVAGPSGMHIKNSEGEDVEEEPPQQGIKEDISVEEDEGEENEWPMGNGGGSDGGDTASGGESSHQECLPHHYSEASNSSSLSTQDPALSSTIPPILAPPQLQEQQENLFQDQEIRHDMDKSSSSESLVPSLDSPFDNFPSTHLDPNNLLQCPICLKEFKVLGSLKRHYRSHINFKPFECDICGKRFTLNQYLIEHRRTHTGERPYMCHVCGKSFAQTGTLYHHVKNVHQISWTSDKTPLS